MEKAGKEVQYASTPTFIDNLPISRDQKRVLSQVEFLARQKLRHCCAKNLYLAVMLDLAEGTVSNIISLLLKQRYLIEKSGFDGRSRHLVLNPAKFPALEEKGQRDRRGATEVRQPMDAASIADGICIHSELTLPPSKMEAASILNGRGKTQNRPQPRMDYELMTDVDVAEPGDSLEDNHDNNHDARAALRPGAGVVLKSSVSCGGASPQTPPGGKPPGPPDVPQSDSCPVPSRTPSRHVNGDSRSTPKQPHNASATIRKVPSGTTATSSQPVPNNGDRGSNDGSSQEADTLLNFFSSILPHFPAATVKVNSQVEELVHKFFKDNPKAIALEVANYFLRTLHLANQQIEYPNGKVFQFGASKSSRRDLEYFFNNLEKVQSEVHDNAVAVDGYVANAASFWDRSLAWLLDRLFELTPEDARTDIEEVFAHEMTAAEEAKNTEAVEKETQRQAQVQRAKDEELKRNADRQRKDEEYRASLDGEVANMPPAKAIQIIEQWLSQVDRSTLQGLLSRDVEVGFEVLRREGHAFPYLERCNTYSGGLRQRLQPVSEETRAKFSEDVGRFRALTGKRLSEREPLLAGESDNEKQC